MRVFLSDGSPDDVRYPEMAFLTARDLTIAIEPRRDDIPDPGVLCNLLKVTRIEPVKPAFPASEEGGSRG